MRGARVVIVGGTSGIGAHVAQLVGAAGAEVTLAGRASAKLDAALAELRAGGVTAAGAVLEARDEDAVERCFAELGEFDHLVSTVGGFMGGGSSTRRSPRSARQSRASFSRP